MVGRSVFTGEPDGFCLMDYLCLKCAVSGCVGRTVPAIGRCFGLKIRQTLGRHLVSQDINDWSQHQI